MYKLNLLKAKHWQLFLYFYGLPFFHQIILISGIVSSILTNNKPDIETVLRYSKFSPLIIMVPILLLLYWFWSVGVGLNNKLSTDIKLKSGVLAELCQQGLFEAMGFNALLKNNTELINYFFPIIGRRLPFDV